MSQQSSWIVETSEATFQSDVVDRSQEVPVVVDFWATWCQPCRLLGPILERLATEYQGRFCLVKANVDQMPAVAGSLGVQSIPAVFAVRDGQIVDQFLGLLPEPQIRAWIDRLLPTAVENLTEEAETLEVINPTAAEAKYRKAIELEPADAKARIGLARVLLSASRLDEARTLIDELAAADLLDTEGERLRAELELRLQEQEIGGLQTAREAAAAEPDNLPLQLNLAKALTVDNQFEEALETALRLVEKDRAGVGEEARKLMVQIFHLLGTESELANTYRRKLTMLLY
ncbi:MAG: tetratricopeptide repeat protein [Thermoguttaceae bacterium]